MGFPHRGFPLTVWVSPIGTVSVSPTGLLFSGCPRQGIRSLDILDAAPVMDRVGRAEAVDPREKEEVRQSKLSRAGPASLGHNEEAQRFKLPNGWRDGVAIDPVLHEMLIGDGQLAVVIAAVLRKLDADAIKHAVG